MDDYLIVCGGEIEILRTGRGVGLRDRGSNP